MRLTVYTDYALRVLMHVELKEDELPADLQKMLLVNAEYSRKWPVTTLMHDAPADARERDDVEIQPERTRR